jgi:hypothetical protein
LRYRKQREEVPQANADFRFWGGSRLLNRGVVKLEAYSHTCSSVVSGQHRFFSSGCPAGLCGVGLFHVFIFIGSGTASN